MDYCSIMETKDFLVVVSKERLTQLQSITIGQRCYAHRTLDCHENNVCVEPCQNTLQCEKQRFLPFSERTFPEGERAGLLRDNHFEKQLKCHKKIRHVFQNTGIEMECRIHGQGYLFLVLSISLSVARIKTLKSLQFQIGMPTAVDI